MSEPSNEATQAAPAAVPTPAPSTPAAAPSFLGLATMLASLPTVRAVLLVISFTCSYIAITRSDKVLAIAADALARAQEDRKSKLHATSLSDAVIRKRQVSAVLASAMSDLQASRSYLFEYHNGVESLRGVPFLFTSSTAEVVAPGVAPQIDSSQRRPIALTVEWLPKFLNGECVTQDADSANAALADAMAMRGTATAVVCPVFAGGAREPLGYVGVSYLRGWQSPLDAATTEKRLQEAARGVGVTIQAYLDLRR